jgi:hypothetical protein
MQARAQKGASTEHGAAVYNSPTVARKQRRNEQEFPA